MVKPYKQHPRAKSKAWRSTSKQPKTKHPVSASSRCAVSSLCGACQYIDVPYQQQLALKQQSIAELFSEIALETTILHPILGMEDPYYYRNKVVSPFAPGKKKRGIQRNKQTAKRPSRAKHEPLAYEVLCGMYAQGSHRIIPTDKCLLENQTAKQIVLTVRDLLEKFGVAPYREDTGSGFMRHVVVRIGHTSGEVLVTLVTNKKEFPGSKPFVRELVKRCPAITTVVQNINTRQTNVILGEHEQKLYGPGFILDRLCGLSFRISSHSFYQVNAAQTEVLYQHALELTQLQEGEVVLDAYCGTGTIGLVAASQAKQTASDDSVQVIGVDNVASAIIDAKNNARHNGITNAKFICADAGEFMKEQAELENNFDVLLMDPPRQGASKDFLDATLKLKPDRIVYISCNPKTQVRDVDYLTDCGYNLTNIQAVDMFPFTTHIENICTLALR